jgi:putative oxidoreductase
MGLPAPYAMAWLAGIVETAGAIMLGLGLFTRTLCFILVGHMTVVVFLAHAASTFRQAEAALFYYVAAMMFYLAGPGRYSLDAMLRRR